MNKWTQYSKDKIDYTGKIFQIVKRPMICGTKKTDFEIARRTPGVRVIIVNKNKSNEYYLTDIIDLMRTENIPIKSYELGNQSIYEIKNVNTKDDLDNLNHFILQKI